MFLQKLIGIFDERRDIAVLDNYSSAVDFCVEHFVDVGNKTINKQNSFSTALSGGSTPKAVYEKLVDKKNNFPWHKVNLFWSDERCVPYKHPDSNFKMAMDAGFSKLPIPQSNIFPMPVEEENLEEGACQYEELIVSKTANQLIDLTILGMGDDGHTASLFPKTHGLHVKNRLVIPNFISEKNIWRMTLTFECINASEHTVIYVFGKSKAKMVYNALMGPFDPDLIPIQNVGTPEKKALWVLDKEAAQLL